jgi:hypothetical protein
VTFLAFLAIPLFAILSPLHGGNWLGKGYLVAISVLCCMALTWACGAPWWAMPAGALPAAIGWYGFRTSKQAQAELTAAQYASAGNVARVWQSYLLPVTVTTLICGGLFVYAKAYVWLLAIAPLLGGLVIPRAAAKAFNHTARPDLLQVELDAQAKGSTDRIFDCRRYQEVCGGAYTGYAVAILIIAIVEGIKHVA